jgi:hypothetical protein
MIQVFLFLVFSFCRECWVVKNHWLKNRLLFCLKFKYKNNIFFEWFIFIWYKCSCYTRIVHIQKYILFYEKYKVTLLRSNMFVGTNIYEHSSIPCNYNWKRAETTWFHNWRSNQIKLVVKKKINLWTEPQWSLLLLLLVIVKGRRSNNCLGVDDSHITFVLGVSYFTGHYNMRWGLANW